MNGPWTIQRILLAILIIGGAIGVMLVVVNQAGIVIPAFIVTIFWIVLGVFIGCLAIKLLFSMFNNSPPGP